MIGPRKGESAICRNGPEGASHKSRSSPFLVTKLYDEQILNVRANGSSSSAMGDEETART